MIGGLLLLLLLVLGCGTCAEFGSDVSGEEVSIGEEGSDRGSWKKHKLLKNQYSVVCKIFKICKRHLGRNMMKKHSLKYN
jgi:hypothetical protein